MALASLLTVQNEIIYERFNGILLNICEALNDIMKDDEDSGEMIEYLFFLHVIDFHRSYKHFIFSSLILTDDTPLDTNGMWNMEAFEYKTYHYERCRQLCLTDPVHTIVLKKYLESQVSLFYCTFYFHRTHYLYV